MKNLNTWRGRSAELRRTSSAPSSVCVVSRPSSIAVIGSTDLTFTVIKCGSIQATRISRSELTVRYAPERTTGIEK